MVFMSLNKFCKLEHMLTWMIRDCIEELFPLITKIVNLSLSIYNLTHVFTIYFSSYSYKIVSVK